MAIQAQFYPSNTGFPLSDTGYGNGGFIESCVNLQQKHQQQQLEQRLLQFYGERKRSVDASLLASNLKPNNATNYNHPSTSNSPSFAIQFEQQREEIDQYIKLQNEKLRFMLQEQRKQQVAALLKMVESDSLHILSRKDEEIAQAVKKREELEEFLTRLESENQAWRRAAQENEATVLSLHKTLAEMKERASSYCLNNNGVVVVAEDAGSCCDENRGNRGGTGENRVECGGGVGQRDVEEQLSREMMMFVCKCCNSGSACFLFLPCRHLCSCKACEAFLDACPVCRTPKKASIETLIF